MDSSKPPSQLTIVFFDGVCGLCNKTVDRLWKADKSELLFFSPLQSRTAETLIPAELNALDTLVLMHGGRFYTQSRAVLKLAWLVKGWWLPLLLLWPFQPFVGDLVYRWVAKNRITWFGELEQCRMPDPNQAHRFLP